MKMPLNLRSLSLLTALSILGGLHFGISSPVPETTDVEILFFVQAADPGTLPGLETTIEHMPSRMLGEVPTVLGDIISRTGQKDVPVGETFTETCQQAALALFSDAATSEGYGLLSGDQFVFAHAVKNGEYVPSNVGRVFIVSKNENGVEQAARKLVSFDDDGIERQVEYRYHIVVQRSPKIALEAGSK